MRLSEIESPGETLQQVHNKWRIARTPPGDMESAVWSFAVKFDQAANGSDPYSAHNSAQAAYNSMVATDTAAQQRHANRKPKEFTGIELGQRQRDAEKRLRGAQKGNQNAVKSNGQVRTGADGRQLRHDRWHGQGPEPQGKNAIQQMKDKWKEFQKTDGTFGKDVAKGSYIAKGLEKVGKGIVAMGDRARAAAKGRFN